MPDVRAQLNAMPYGAIMAAVARLQQAQSVMGTQATAPAPAPASPGTHDFARHGALLLAEKCRGFTSIHNSYDPLAESSCQQTQIQYSPPILMLRLTARHDQINRYMLVDGLVDTKRQARNELMMKCNFAKLESTLERSRMANAVRQTYDRLQSGHGVDLSALVIHPFGQN